eukprot:g17320.t1
MQHLKDCPWDKNSPWRPATVQMGITSFAQREDAAIAKNSFRYGETLGHAMATLDSSFGAASTQRIRSEDDHALLGRFHAPEQLDGDHADVRQYAVPRGEIQLAVLVKATLSLDPGSQQGESLECQPPLVAPDDAKPGAEGRAL